MHKKASYSQFYMALSKLVKLGVLLAALKGYHQETTSFEDSDCVLTRNHAKMGVSCMFSLHQYGASNKHTHATIFAFLQHALNAGLKFGGDLVFASFFSHAQHLCLSSILLGSVLGVGPWPPTNLGHDPSLRDASPMRRVQASRGNSRGR